MTRPLLTMESEFETQQVGDRTTLVSNGREFEAILVFRANGTRKYQIDDDRAGEQNGLILVCTVQQ